ncbi:autotransporter assembly complex protein TamA [Massilia yuzhufengensis]|uniref:Translocation and assembly module subunit TamA n=1 Tax=Massilia yuzhufengensis TaxID=1164594 RepID=A0A1I1P9T5_9BURK|nr:autotransporter assembly complex family protein [Massilia yuzhufengensis]SFD02750.1 autotransporter secretion outer membrane protein TamA [Massilia yuzhufengensis]
MFPARSIPRSRLRPLLGVGAFFVATALHAQGIDYQVRIDAPRQIENMLEDNLDLMRWRGNARVDMEQLQRLVKEAPEQAKTLIATEGYYSPKISSGLDTSGGKPVARVIVDPGPAVLVGDVDLVLQGFVPFEKGGAPFDAGSLRSRWQLPVGARFRQADWEAAKRELLRDVQQTRFPRARLVDTSATVDPDELRALLHVVIDSGPEMRFGALRIRGLTRYPKEVITNLNKINPGDMYSEAALQALQSRLQDTGYFSSVEVSADMRAVLNAELQELKEGDDDADANPATPEPPTGPTVLPVLVRVTENKRKAVEVGVGFSTDTGARAQISYDDLNVFGKRMKNDLLYEQKRQTVRTDFYWPTTAKGFNDSVGAGVERNDLRGEITTLATVAARRAWGSPLLERSLTLEALIEKREVPPNEPTSTRSLPLTYSITKRQLDSLIQPTNGYVIQGQLGGALLPILTDEKFLRLYLRGLYLKPLGESGTLVLRGEFGGVAAKDKIGVPSTFLFRAGGDQSVRGYGYRELGVRENGAIVGGKYMLTASAEYQYWFRPPWGVAVFYDAGNAADKVGDLKPKSGFGVGARWRSPVGPINVDVAYGHAVKKARLHFSLGFTF